MPSTCAYIPSELPYLLWYATLAAWHYLRCLISRITKMRDSCAAEFEQHWNCLEKHNQVRSPSCLYDYDSYSSNQPRAGVLSVSKTRAYSQQVHVR